MRILYAVLVILSATNAAAQSAAMAKPWDVAATTGVFVSHPDNPPATESYDDWYHSAALGIAFGHYITPHVKVEGEATLTGEGSRYGQRMVEIVPGAGPYPVALEQLTRTSSVSGAVVWQFFDNQWVHPFLFAGATVDFDRRALHTWRQSYFRGDPRGPGSEIVLATEGVEPLGTTTTARGLIGGGAKLYMSPNTFFRADTRIGIGARSSGHAAFRLGFGVDF